MAKISGNEIKEYLATGGKFIAGLAIEAYGNSLNQIGEEAFSDAIEIGITNTIATLYDANIDDGEIIRLLNKHWGIIRDEAEERLIFEKSQAVIRELKHHLKMQGLSDEEIRRFMTTNKVSAKIRHNHDLWKLRRNPEKLMKEVQRQE